MHSSEGRPYGWRTDHGYGTEFPDGNYLFSFASSRTKPRDLDRPIEISRLAAGLLEMTPQWSMRIIIGADHRGFPLKEELKAWLTDVGHTVEDVGAASLIPSDDYPDVGAAVGRMVAADPEARGIVLCGSGIGIAIAANKVRGVRAGTCATSEQAAAARADEDVNVLALSADALDFARAQAIIEAFLATPFSGAERHVRRLRKIADVESALGNT